VRQNISCVREGEGMPRLELEHLEQCALIQWCEIMSSRYPVLELLFAIPNGGSRHPFEAVKLKRAGVRRGVPDLFLPYPANYKHGLWLEMKSPTGRVSPEQLWWSQKLTECGYQHNVCRSCQEAITIISEYLNIKGVSL
jgi:hypothetical protein